MFSFLRHLQPKKPTAPIFMTTIKSFMYADNVIKESSLSRAYQHDKKHFPEALYAPDKKGRTPFIQAVLKGDLFTVQWLLSRNNMRQHIDLTHTDHSNQSAFNYAAKLANAAELQITEGMSRETEWLVTMDQKLKPGRDEIFKILIDHSKEPVLVATINSFTSFTTNKQKESFLFSAYMHDKKWFSNPELTNADGVTPMTQAALNADLFTINWLNAIDTVQHKQKPVAASSFTKEKSKKSPQPKPYQVSYFKPVQKEHWKPFIASNSDSIASNRPCVG